MPEPPDLTHITTALPGGSLSFDGVDAYAIERRVPSVIVKPATQTEVATALAAANAIGAAVVPFGGGTQQALGMTPERYDIALDLRRLDALIEHEPADLTVTVEAGISFGSLQALLGEKGQWLTLDPPVSPDATIGGILATNTSGPARLSRGTARDLVTGMTVATAEGHLVKSGGRVVKNVAGYDLSKLHIGALGTTGVILQASFKLSPLPPTVETLAVDGDAPALARLHSAVETARLPLQGSWLAKQPSDAHWQLALRFAGGAAAVDRAQRETHALAASSGLSVTPLEEATWRALAPDYTSPVVARCSVPPTRALELAEKLSLTGAAISAMPGVGIVHGAWQETPSVDMLRSLRDHCVAQAGALILERAPAETKQQFDVWGEAGEGLALMRRLKEQMDPGRILNPGRYVGGI